MSASHSLEQEVVDGEDEETDSEDGIDGNIIDHQMTQKQNVEQSIKKKDIINSSKNITNTNDIDSKGNDINNNESKNNENGNENMKGNTTKYEMMKSQFLSKSKPKKKKKPQFFEIKARSKFDIMKVGFNRMLKSGKKIVEKNFKQRKHGIWENAIFDATTGFHEKTFKSISINLNTIKKQTEKSKSQCQQSVNDLHFAKGQIQKSNKTLIQFYDTNKYKLTKLF